MNSSKLVKMATSIEAPQSDVMKQATNPPPHPLDIPTVLKRTRTPDTEAKVAPIAEPDKKRRKGRDIATPPTKPRQTPEKAKGDQGAAKRANSKTALVAALLQRKEGCTTADILKATGWPSVSVPAMAKAAGLKLIREKKKGEVTRYRAE